MKTLSIVVVSTLVLCPIANAQGVVRAWGWNGYGACDVPADLGVCAAVAPAGDRTVALRPDGQVRAWGLNDNGQCDIPADLGACKAIAAASLHTVALRQDGIVRAWGFNGDSRCSVPADLGTCTVIAAGAKHTVALRQDGVVRAWGDNATYLQCNVPGNLGVCTAVAAGGYHTVALRQDGIVRAWGRYSEGQCDVPASLGSCRAIAAGEAHTVALRQDGIVRAWGSNAYGQCNVSASLGICKAISAAGSQTVALLQNGGVRAWGWNGFGGCDSPADLGACTAISAGGNRAYALQSLNCIGDLNQDERVDGSDLGVVLGQWATSGGTTGADVNLDGAVNGADLGLLLSKWGPCPPTVVSIVPASGCFLGGTQITITGAFLGTATAVTIGDMPVTNLVTSPTSINAKSPAGALGPAVVRVTTAAGTYTASQPFDFMPMSATSITPNSGATAGGLQVTITGANLELTTGVTIGSAPCTNVTIVNATTVTAVTPPGTLGNADVVVTGSKGTTTFLSGYTYINALVVPSWAALVQAEPDPAVIADPALRAAITATGYAWRVCDIRTQMEMLLVPPGTFFMGCIMGSNQSACDSSRELPVHQVTLTNAFYLGRYEVTQSQWTETIHSNPSYFQGYSDSARRPLENVSWTAVQTYLSATGMRLPTEAEWEYACRAGTQTPFYNGSVDDLTLGTLAWYGANCVGTKAVGGKAANGYGFHDMLGNVNEYVKYWYGTYSNTSQTNPAGPAYGTYRVSRGGGWQYGSKEARSSFRLYSSANSTTSNGFRVARNP